MCECKETALINATDYVKTEKRKSKSELIVFFKKGDDFLIDINK